MAEFLVEVHDVVDSVLTKLVAALETNGLKVFAVIDHSGAAEEAGLELPNTKVILAGNPKAGTPLMRSHPDLATDLPPRISMVQTGPQTTALYYSGIVLAVRSYPDLAEQGLAMDAKITGIIKEAVG
jgi:uncharacterized protein (DUF302 family)